MSVEVKLALFLIVGITLTAMSSFSYKPITTAKEAGILIHAKR